MNNWNWKNQIKKPEKEDDMKDLLVFGYSSRIYSTDAQSDNIAEERHMVPCWGDSENRVDRRSSKEEVDGTIVEYEHLKWYDCRLLLHSAEDINKNENELNEECPTEAMEEEMCQEERYIDLYKDIQLQKEREEEEEEKRRQSSKAQIGFSYDSSNPVAKEEEDSDSEDEPFEAPEGIKFPVGLELPPNMKLLHIIEKTASFVVANGAQMEIVIKAKQRNNLKNFGFLDFDHSLYPFYKYIQKLLREKKYTPNLTKKKKSAAVGETSVSIKKEAVKPSIPSSLAAIAQEHASDSEDGSDSDSDCELHPSLLGGGLAKKAPSPEKTGMIGPRIRPKTPNAPINFNVKPIGDFSQRNDVYASLFKNLAHVHRNATGVEEIKMGGKEVEQHKMEPTPSVSENDGRVDDPDYREWYQMFYHRPCPWIGPKPMLPPTPDLEPVLSSYAEYVARRGVEFEQSLAARPDLQLHFMDPKSPYFSYYHQKVRTFQWQLSQDYAAFTQKTNPIPQSTSSINLDMSVPPPNLIESPGPSSVPSPAPIVPEVSLNRRQRRLLLDVNQPKGFGEAVPISGPGIVDPIALKTELPKSSSTPANLQSLNSKPISFTVLPKVEELKLAGNPILSSDAPSCSFTADTSFDPDLTFSETAQKEKSPTPVDGEESTVIPGLEPPPPPAIPNNTQLDRKEKARIFMEKLLQEKRMKKQKEEENRLKLEEESIRKAEKISEVLSDPKKRSSAYSRDDESNRPKVSTIDEIINSRINSLLVESGFKPEETTKEVEKKPDDEGEKKKKKKHKKRSRSRSRSDDETDRKKSRKESRRKRSRSRSPERGSRRYRSRSRDRSYRR